MVDPVSDEERQSFLQKTKIGFVIVVGLSGGLMGLRIDAGLTGLAIAIGAGLLAGILVVWIAFPDRMDLRRGRSRRGRDR